MFTSLSSVYFTQREIVPKKIAYNAFVLSIKEMEIVALSLTEI